MRFSVNLVVPLIFTSFISFAFFFFKYPFFFLIFPILTAKRIDIASAY